MCGLTSDRIALATSVVTMPQKKGGTNAGIALTTCLNLFNADNRGAHRTIVLLTDGDISGAREVLAALIQGNVNLICIGIGLHPNAVNNVMSIANSSIYVHDFTEMNLVVSGLSVKPGNPPKLNVRTRSSRQASFDIVSSVQFTLADVQGLEEGSNEWIVLSSAQSNVAWVKGLRPNTMFKLRAKIQTGAGWSAWSKEVELRTLRDNPETAVLKSPQLHQKVLDSVKALENFSIPSSLKEFGIEYLNIAYMGRIGNGKSANFDTIWSIMSGTYSEPQMARNDIVTVTLNISKRFLVNNKHNAIRLCDTYGWKGGESWSQELEFFLNGALKDGYKENDPVLSSLNTSPTVGDCVHAIIIVYELPSVFTESHINELKSFFNKLNSKGYQPIVILTKPDLIEEANLNGKLSDIFESGIIDQHIQTFSKNTKIPVANIFPVMNYRGSYTNRDWVLERLALNAFEAAITRARVKLANDLKKHILVVNNGKTVGTATFDGNSDTSLQLIRESISKSIQALKSSKSFSFKNMQGAIDTASEAGTPFVRVGKQNNEHGFWQVEVMLNSQQTPQKPKASPQSPGASIPNEVTVLNKKQEPVGILIFEEIKPNNLSDMRAFICEQLDVSDDFRFVTLKNTDVPLDQEGNTGMAQCLRNGMVVINDNPSDGEEEPLAVLQKDKVPIGLCFASKAITLRELKKKLVEQGVLQGNFVFLFKGIPITEKQLDLMQTERITFQHDGETSFCIHQS
jgi:hypothetical protein